MKDNSIKFRINDTDKKEIIEYCLQNNISLSEFMRESAFSKMQKITKEQYALDKQLLNEINHIGNNINQIAKRYNSDNFLSDTDKEKLFVGLNDVKNLIHEHNEFDKKRFRMLIDKKS